MTKPSSVLGIPMDKSEMAFTAKALSPSSFCNLFRASVSASNRKHHCLAFEAFFARFGSSGNIEGPWSRDWVT